MKILKRCVKHFIKTFLPVICIFVLFLALDYLYKKVQSGQNVSPSGLPQITASPEPTQTPELFESDGILRVTFLDVGNADCSIIEYPDGKVMMIDAGNNDDGDDIVSYLRSRNILRIDYLIGTHPHEDHIGGLDRVIDEFDVGTLYMPRIPNNYVPSTKTYNSVLKSVQNKGLKITSPSSGDSVCEDCEVDAIFLNQPDENLAKDNMNEYSLVLKLTYGYTSFLFTGDAEKDNEYSILNEYGDYVASDVLKVGHHGSSTSSTQEWLDAVSPRIVLIPCGENNDYGHPHDKVIKRLEALGAKIYRSDKNGTVVMESDGNEIRVNCEK